MLHYEKLDAVLQEIMTRWQVPGLAVGIVDRTEIVHARGFGVQSLETRAPVTPDSIFCLASVAKPFVATAVMQLAERGRIDLDAPIVQYLPYFKLDGERYRQITIRQMLSHTSGMPDMDESEYDELVDRPEYDDGAAERYVRALGSRGMVAAPGERFSYSNIAYNVLGDLIAKIAGQTFEATMVDNVLLPAGMPGSTFFFPEVPRDRLAVPHIRAPEMIVRPTYPYHRADAPASFMYSTAIDMCHWCHTCLSRRILSPSGWDAMWTPVANRSSSPLYEKAGLGWTLGHFGGVNTVSHGGAGFGWTAFLLLMPEIERAAVILCNEESSACGVAVKAVANTLLSREPQPGPVSWIVPISRALQRGGIEAAYACYAEIEPGQEIVLDPDDLVTLALQLGSAGKLDLAIDVLALNLRAFPGHADTLACLVGLQARRSRGPMMRG